MVVMTLDVKGTHINNPECPARIVPMPNGGWMCVDCGCQILQKLVDTGEPPRRLEESVDADIPVHVSHSETSLYIKVDAAGREEAKGTKMCQICRLPMVKSMTNLYYYCPTCGLSMGNDTRKDRTTVPAGKGYG